MGCARLGFTGKASIHPDQIPIIHEAFTPTQVQIDKARRALAAFEQNKTGLVVVDGELIELPGDTVDEADIGYRRAHSVQVGVVAVLNPAKTSLRSGCVEVAPAVIVHSRARVAKQSPRSTWRLWNQGSEYSRWSRCGSRDREQRGSRSTPRRYPATGARPCGCPGRPARSGTGRPYTPPRLTRPCAAGASPQGSDRHLLGQQWRAANSHSASVGRRLPTKRQ